MVNLNIGKEIKTGPTTEIGKFRASLNAFRDDAKVPARNVPKKLRQLYSWYKGLKTSEIEYLLELKNLYKVMQDATLPSLLDKMVHNEPLSKKDVDALKLIKDILVESHKLKYGDKKVIENVVTYEDIRKQIFSSKKIIDAEVIKDESVSQDLDRSGCREGHGVENREDIGDNTSTTES